jgi:hypothetical protein
MKIGIRGIMGINGLIFRELGKMLKIGGVENFCLRRELSGAYG